MLRKVTHCAGRVSANTKPHQLRWGDREKGTAISCTKYSQVAGLIQKLEEIPRSSKVPSFHPAVLRAAALCSKILRSDHRVRERVRARAYRGAGGTGSTNG